MVASGSKAIIYVIALTWFQREHWRYWSQIICHIFDNELLVHITEKYE